MSSDAYDLRAIQERLRLAYPPQAKDWDSAPVASKAIHFCLMAEWYIVAAGRLQVDDDSEVWVKLLFPDMLLRGLAVELALKAYLLACGRKIKKIHDLVQLTEGALAAGLKLPNEQSAAAIVHLNHVYFEDLATGTNYVCRYGGGQLTVDMSFGLVNAIVDSIVSQARAKIVEASPVE